MTTLTQTEPIVARRHKFSKDSASKGVFNLIGNDDFVRIPTPPPLPFLGSSLNVYPGNVISALMRSSLLSALNHVSVKATMSRSLSII